MPHALSTAIDPALGAAPVLATGAWLKNQACLWRPGEAPVWSGLVGDLSDPAACRQLDDAVQHWLDGPEALRPQRIAHDLHPDFYSTHCAQAWGQARDLPVIAVQHHHAHIAAVIAEHGVASAVIGLALDGVGMGTDGTAWGGELLCVAPGAWQRLGHLLPLAMAGGDSAARQPWRMAAAAMVAGGADAQLARQLPDIDTGRLRLLRQLLDSPNTPRTSSAGRWFDAAAALLGLAPLQQQEAEAAIALQQAAMACTDPPDTARGAVDTARLYPPGDAPSQLDLRPVLASLWQDGPPADPIQRQRLALGFHLQLADALVVWAHAAARLHGIDTVCLGGGCWLNPLLREATVDGLQQCGLRVLLPQLHPPGDSAIALGQAWVAATTPIAAPEAASAPNPLSRTQPCA